MFFILLAFALTSTEYKMTSSNVQSLLRYVGVVTSFMQRDVYYRSYEAIKEALIEKSDSFSGRIESDVIDLIRNRRGLFFTNIGKEWKKWHDFAVHNIPTTREGLMGVLS